jgi:glycosyltransferase involved in cell wall biosynthesis
MTISVVVSCYNYGRFLKHCLDSLKSQTHTDFDVIVIDDGSTDDSAEVVKPFLNDPRFRYHYQPNQGQAAAKNAGIHLTSGELVAFLDADDAWTPDKLERQLPLFSNPAVGVVYCSLQVMDQSGHLVPTEGAVGYWREQRGHVTKWLAFDNFVPFSSAVVRRTLLTGPAGAFDESLHMGIDWDLWLRLSRVTEFNYVPARLMLYRCGHSNQMSKNWNGRVAAADTIFAKFKRDHPTALTADELRQVEWYNACSRAGVYREIDLRKSTALLCKAVRLFPFTAAPYVGLVKNASAMMRRYASRKVEPQGSALRS